jgi:sulfotransferase family protein
MIAQLDRLFISLSKKKTYTRLVSYFFEGRPLTTKGRWINPLVFLVYRILARFKLGCRKVDPVYILGTGRSGTTVLGLTLSMHKDVGFLNEPKALWSFLIEGEDLIGSYSSIPGAYEIDPDIADKTLIQKYMNIMSGYMFLSRSKKVLDKYPELIFRYGLVKKISPNAKLLFLYRNGWDTCHSIELWSRRLGTSSGSEVHDWWGRNNQKWRALTELLDEDDALRRHKEKIRKYNDHRYMAAVEWILSMKKGMELLDKDPESVLAVKYEDYVSSKAERNKVLEFCGLEPDKIYEYYCEQTLSPPKRKEEISLPEEIEGEFKFVMGKLGYDD